MAERGDELLQIRLDKVHRLRRAGIDPYPPRFRRTHSSQKAAALLAKAESRQPDAYTASVAVAGRIASIRAMGRAAFLDLHDSSGRLQIHLRRDLLKDAYDIPEPIMSGRL